MYVVHTIHTTTVVGDNINILKTTFHLSFSYQGFFELQVFA